ncbi:uncharacterized protein LOC100838380 [Brachypodium distachyon]|uniref:Uncharacterized protein n=1 Tax=Brachypodium distachyon TaxID=15368 RepID=A0A0Q3R7H9_BRADI|nr:uncharacterized protein LOC100838380 [Brachypodium distachyon]KQK09274.1 hypothetical protein BRADI_2g47103v3 [Brachypodium distachyon]|eukprot:XP_003567013.1 uncharacterized protein LOC100838380 [Brachypodium distachyon]
MDAGHATAAQETDDDAPRKKKTAARKRWGDEGSRERGLSPAAPPDDPGKDAALAECAVSCCIFCACLPVAALCCVARAPVRAARRCWRWRATRRRPPRRLAPGGSSSFSDAELGDFRQGRRRTMADEDHRPRSRSPRGCRTAPPPAHPQQPPLRDRRR